MAPFLIHRHAIRQAALLRAGFNLKESPSLGILFLCSTFFCCQTNERHGRSFPTALFVSKQVNVNILYIAANKEQHTATRSHMTEEMICL